jgi:Ni/Co efflux regulator RcnB
MTMKTKIAALALLLLASASGSAMAQEQPRQHEPRAAQVNEGDRPHRSWSPEARAQRAPEARRAERPPEAPSAPQASGERRPGGGEGWSGREGRQDRGGGAGRGEGRGRWNGGDQAATRTPTPGVTGQRDHNSFGEGRRWTGGDQTRDGERRGGQRPGGDGRNGDRQDGNRRDGQWQGGGDHRNDGDRRGGDSRWRGDNNDRWRGDNRDNHGRPRWDRNRYPPVYRSQQRYRGSFWRPPVGFYARSWGYGDILPYGWYGGSYRLNDWWIYDLPMPPPGFDWVRVGDDALLIDRFTGRVYQVVRDLFW